MTSVVDIEDLIDDRFSIGMLDYADIIRLRDYCNAIALEVRKKKKLDLIKAKGGKFGD